jgi:hypothetical protein
MMGSPWVSLIAFALCSPLPLGVFVRARWPEHHTNRETIELLQSTVMMLATFAAIVLGLLLTSAKSDFDSVENDIRNFSAPLVELDYSLEQLGPSGVPIRQQLVRYLGAALAAAWSDQPPPPGNYYPLLPRTATPGGPREFAHSRPDVGAGEERAARAARVQPVRSTRPKGLPKTHEHRR